jgi:hypothetical protein
MDAKTFSLVAGVIFAVAALFHLARDFHGVDRHHRRLVDTDVGELDRARCRR